MTDDRLARFDAHRPHLLGIAYRMLGEMSAAEDVVQEAWLRWQRADAEEVRDPRAWLSAVTVRLSLDALRKARARRETYVGPWLPEPLLARRHPRACRRRACARAELASDLSLALLHVLERLSPEERAALDPARRVRLRLCRRLRRRRKRPKRPAASSFRGLASA